jgi:hypothetical protein
MFVCVVSTPLLTTTLLVTSFTSYMACGNSCVSGCLSPSCTWSWVRPNSLCMEYETILLLLHGLGCDCQSHVWEVSCFSSFSCMELGTTTITSHMRLFYRAKGRNFYFILFALFTVMHHRYLFVVYRTFIFLAKGLNMVHSSLFSMGCFFPFLL